MVEIINFLNTKWNEPQIFGIYHIISLVAVALITFLLCRFIKNPTEKTVRKILLITSIIVIVLEIYKQFIFTFYTYEGQVFHEYKWYSFPFQFCSTPMYIGLIASFVKNQRVHKALCAYLATFALFAGAVVMIYPGDVFVSTVGINFQTVVCHGSMIVIGIFLMYTGYVKVEHKTILKAIPVFAIMLGIACILNEVAHRAGLTLEDNFNMFYISPYGIPSLPVLSLIQPHLPFILELVVYVIGFSIAAYVMLLIGIGVSKIKRKG